MQLKHYERQRQFIFHSNTMFSIVITDKYLRAIELDTLDLGTTILYP